MHINLAKYKLFATTTGGGQAPDLRERLAQALGLLALLAVV